jgi:4'-phosphopantetheinyl transferase
LFGQEIAQVYKMRENCFTVQSGRMSNLENVWRASPVRPAVPLDHIDVWQICLDVPESDADPHNFLASDEMWRAERFHFARDRQRFVRCRSAAREILGRYLEVPPQNIRFIYETNGKPQITDDQNQRQLRFNISHSSGLAVMAVVSGRAIGVDVEKIKSNVEYLDLAKRFFSTNEYRKLSAMPTNRLARAFFACWTRKEAFIKACGEGLSFPLSEFSVSIDPDAPATLQDVRTDPGAAARWSLINLEPREGYIGALAVEGPAQPIERWCFNLDAEC